ncbi:hypothetical protein ACLOJK_009419 [Asimina triloba]
MEYVSDVDHIDRLISCLHMALPFFLRGASNSKFLNYLNKHIIPVFDEVVRSLPEERKPDLLKNLAECSPYTTPQDSRQLLPSVVQLLKTPNATNSLCGYKIVTGQPSDRLGEDFSEQYKDFTERLTNVEDLARGAMKKLTQGMAEHNKSMAAAKTEEAKASIKMEKHNTTTGLRTCNNILSMAQPLHSKSPAFIGDKKISLSWKEAAKPAPSSTKAAAGGKRNTTAANGSGAPAPAPKKGRGMGGVQNQLVNRALEGLSQGRGGGARNRGWGGGRDRGRGYR